MKALIIGAGIGGLATALSLRRIGIATEVYEKAPELKPVGAGLTIWSNGHRALQELGVDLQAGQLIRRYSNRNARGRTLGHTDVATLSQRAGAPSRCVHRGDLQQVLLQQTRVHTDHELERLEHDATGVTAHFKNGSSVRGDLLIGADGIHSRVRDLLFGAAPRRFAGYTSWRAIVKPPNFPLDPDHGLLILGPGSELGIMHVGDGRYYFFATRPGHNAPDWRARFRRYAEPVPQLLDALSDQDVIHTDIYDRPPAKVWGQGRVTLLGDSIHPVTPNLGQGACQALESAVWLAYSLKTHPKLEDALRAYEAARRPRTAALNRQSWQAGKMLTWSNPMLVWLRDRLLAWPPLQRYSERNLEALISWRVPAI